MNIRLPVFLLVLLPFVARGEEKPVDFSRDIKPLLSNYCYACHGPDANQRKADLRLDVREAAIDSAIVPGKSGDSELIERMISNDPELKMPPAASKKPALSAAEIDLLRRWIDEGAKFGVHWSYTELKRPNQPEHDKQWAVNEIDHFVSREHKQHGFKPSADADRRTLIRRLYFDLLGLPPSSADVNKFVDAQDSVIASLVDHLLASEHYGERMALYWMDLVRYADTNGVHGDNHRDHALYRDYVIKAFNTNKPFDQFTIEQLAGDLIPDATKQQRIASGYNRLNLTTREGGAQAKEYITKYAADRVRNASVVWMGTTLGCAQCHNHKFDPFTQRDFYSFAAFFADIQETPVGTQQPTKIATDEQEHQLKQLDEQLAALRTKLNTQTPELTTALETWIASKRKELTTAPNIAKAVQTEAKDRTAQQQDLLERHFRGICAELAPTRKQVANLEAKRKSIVNAFPPILVSMAGNPRMVRVLPRGNWLDDSGEVVQPAIPESFGALGGEARATRMDLAKWFVQPDNPLVARVFVNRLWKLFFGSGIVTSLDDYGAQGTLPSHPELLDWLASEFIESGWNVKHMVKLMVMSRTYRQSSLETKGRREQDPANIWLARQGRFRLDAEFVRDNALSISGLLVNQVGGTSVKPYQPAGYWAHLNFPRRQWKHDAGDSQYRRGMYTYWCRTFPHPSLLAFDAQSREESCVQRPRSNTPLQALVLLNDPTYVEAARVFAARIISDGGANDTDRLAFAFEQALNRKPHQKESTILTGLLQRHRGQFKADAKAADELLTVGQSKTGANLDHVELAAWTSVARVIFNLHETITRN